MVRQEPPEYWDRERPSVSPGSAHHVRISVLVLDSVVNDVAMVVDTRDNLRQWFFSSELVLRYRLIEALSRRHIEKLRCVTTENGSHQLDYRQSID